MSGSSAGPRPADYEAVHKIQAGYKIIPLSRWGKPAQPVTGKIDPVVDMKTPPKIQVDTMPAGKFFAYAAGVLKLQPPHLTDQPIVALMRRRDRAGKELQHRQHRQGRAGREAGIGERSRRCSAAHGVETQDARPRC
jgi:hypothetical protein